jgi:hypothetical protein
MITLELLLVVRRIWLAVELYVLILILFTWWDFLIMIRMENVGVTMTMRGAGLLLLLFPFPIGMVPSTAVKEPVPLRAHLFLHQAGKYVTKLRSTIVPSVLPPHSGSLQISAEDRKGNSCTGVGLSNQQQLPTSIGY